MVLPLPSIEVLAEVATSQTRTSIVVHVLESFVVTWMKLIKVSNNRNIIEYCPTYIKYAYQICTVMAYMFKLKHVRISL